MIQIIKTVKHGLEVYLVRDRVFMSEAGARTYVKQLLSGGVR